jgi:Na+/melibiose symporter-like transporter
MAFLRWCRRLAAVGATFLAVLLVPAVAWAYSDDPGAELARRYSYGRRGPGILACCCFVVVLIVVLIVYLVMRRRRPPNPPPPPPPV